MTSPQPKQSMTAAQRRARILLAAWNSGDLSRLRQALDQRPDGSTRGPDQEREELIEAATETVRIWLQKSQACPEVDLQVSLRLLNHLATGNQLSLNR